MIKCTKSNSPKLHYATKVHKMYCYGCIVSMYWSIITWCIVLYGCKSFVSVWILPMDQWAEWRNTWCFFYICIVKCRHLSRSVFCDSDDSNSTEDHLTSSAVVLIFSPTSDGSLSHIRLTLQFFPCTKLLHTASQKLQLHRSQPTIHTIQDPVSEPLS